MYLYSVVVVSEVLQACVQLSGYSFFESRHSLGIVLFNQKLFYTYLAYH